MATLDSAALQKGKTLESSPVCPACDVCQVFQPRLPYSQAQRRPFHIDHISGNRDGIIDISIRLGMLCNSGHEYQISTMVRQMVRFTSRQYTKTNNEASSFLFCRLFRDSKLCKGVRQYRGYRHESDALEPLRCRGHGRWEMYGEDVCVCRPGLANDALQAGVWYLPVSTTCDCRWAGRVYWPSFYDTQTRSFKNKMCSAGLPAWFWAHAPKAECFLRRRWRRSSSIREG